MINFKANKLHLDVHASRRNLIKHAALGGLTVTGLSGLNSLAKMNTTPVMPSLFVGHGDPMNAISDNPFTREWQRVAENLPVPNAILTVSAHWQTKRTAVLTSEKPKLIYDVYGFPDELYKVQYPAPGAPDIAEQTVHTVTSFDIATTEEWGLDHGAWSILAKLFPNAQVPVFQLSLGRDLSLIQHFQLAQELSSLRHKGVLIVGSGNIVHNLRVWHNDMKAGRGEILYDWAIAFDEKIATVINERNYAGLTAFDEFGLDATMSHPTLEHYIPLLYTTGSANPEKQASFFAEGFEGGSFSMRSVFIVG